MIRPIMLGFVLFGTLAPAVQQGGGTAASAPPFMPADLARATFDDARVKTFLKFASSADVGGRCSVPDPDKTPAKTTPMSSAPGPVGPDMASTYYEIEIPCGGGSGPTTVRILAEFVTLRAGPLNLTVSLVYRQ